MDAVCHCRGRHLEGRAGAGEHGARAAAGGHGGEPLGDPALERVQGLAPQHHQRHALRAVLLPAPALDHVTPAGRRCEGRSGVTWWNNFLSRSQLCSHLTRLASLRIVSVSITFINFRFPSAPLQMLDFHLQSSILQLQRANHLA